MVFEKSRVYTSENADELKVGSKVYVANTLEALKKQVIENLIECRCTLEHVMPESYAHRFMSYEDNECYLFAYLVSEPEENKLKWTDLKLFDKVHNKVTGETAVVTGIMPKAQAVCIAEHYTNDLEEWEKVEE